MSHQEMLGYSIFLGSIIASILTDWICKDAPSSRR